jgi:hypothetical protein
MTDPGALFEQIDTAGHGKAKAQSRGKRKLTEERREQNRRAQRIWREKQKVRREDEVRTRVKLELERLGYAGQGDIVGREVLGEVEGQWASQPGKETKDIERPLPCEARIDVADVGLGLELEKRSAEESVDSDEHFPLGVAVQCYVPALPGVESYRAFWAQPDGYDFKTYTLPRGARRRSSPASQYSSPWPSRPLSPASSTYAGRIPSTLPSPYKNHLQLVGESCWAATMSIAQPLGITMQSYVNDHPSPFCPIPGTTTQYATYNQQLIFQLPLDLRPTAYQLMIPHPSYLDCIAFPHFRSMAIYLASVRKLDHASFFLDLMHDGMVCWGREHANARHGRSMADGVPWKRRSWEVRPWFWRKWGWIAGLTMERIDAGCEVQPGRLDVEDDGFDDEDGMLSGSQWWWALHGEEGEVEHWSGGATSWSSATMEPTPEEHESFVSSFGTFNVGIRKPEETHLLYHWE